MVGTLYQCMDSSRSKLVAIVKNGLITNGEEKERKRGRLNLVCPSSMAGKARPNNSAKESANNNPNRSAPNEESPNTLGDKDI